MCSPPIFKRCGEALLSTALLLFGPQMKAAQSAAFNPLQPGSPAPLFDRPSLRGGSVRLRALRGRVVLLNFWASWCAPCLAEMPVFGQWQRDDAAHGLLVIGVAMDDTAEPARTVVRRLRLSYPVVMGDASVGRAYGGVLGLPVTILIDKQGRVRRRYDGAVDLLSLRHDVDALLRQP